MLPNENALGRFLRLIRFSHTIFALPFALGALLVATAGRPSPRLLALVLLCMVCARTAVMLFNRIFDWSLDQRNPRTATRHQLVSRPVALLLLVFSSAAFIAAAAAMSEGFVVASRGRNFLMDSKSPVSATTPSTTARPRALSRRSAMRPTQR